MKKKLGCFFHLTLLLLLSGSVLHAQQNPGDTTITFGFSWADQPRHAEAGSAKIKVPVNFRLKVHPKLIVGVDHDSFLAKRGTDGNWSEGIGNVALVVRPELLSQEAGRALPTVRITYVLTIPVASVAKGLGTGRFDHKILGTVRRVLDDTATRQTMLGLDFGGSFAGHQNDSGFKKSGLLNLYFERDLDRAQKYNLHGEVDLISRAENSPSQIFSTNYLRVKLNARVSVTGGFNVGITPTASCFGAYGSIILNGPKLW